MDLSDRLWPTGGLVPLTWRRGAKRAGWFSDSGLSSRLGYKAGGSDAGFLVQSPKTTSKRFCPTCSEQYDCLPGASVCPQDNTPLVPVKQVSMLGGVIAEKYRVDELIGQGGWALVYKGEHLSLKRPVAIKILQEICITDDAAPQDMKSYQKVAFDAEKFARFQKEATAVAALSHPNLCQVYDFGLLPSQEPYLVLEYISGESLQQRIARLQRLPIGEALSIFRQATDALAVAHSQGIVHRDLKPGNMMVVEGQNGDLLLKIIDFGLVKIVGEQADGMSLTATGDALGTPIYMSPEQCMGTGRLDQRTDIYSLGCVMYELLSGEKAFIGDTSIDVMIKKLNKEPQPMSKVAPDINIPPAIEDIVMKCLKRNAKDRPQSMQKIKDVIESVDTMALSRGVNQSRASAKPKWQRQMVPLLLAGVGIACGACFLWLKFSSDQERSSPDQTPSNNLTTPSVMATAPPAVPITQSSPAVVPRVRAPSVRSATMQTAPMQPTPQSPTFSSPRIAVNAPDPGINPRLAEIYFGKLLGDLRRTSKVPEHDSVDIALAARQLAQAKFKLGKLSESAKLYDVALAYLNLHFPIDSSWRIQTSAMAAVCYWDAGEKNKAIKLLYDLQQKCLQRPPDALGVIVFDFSQNFYADRDQLSLALSANSQYLRLVRALHGERSTTYYSGLQRRKDLLARQGKGPD